MPSDQLEDFFREKMRGLPDTPPAPTPWNQEASWEKLQQTLPVRPRRQNRRVFLGLAAALALALVAGMVVWQYVSRAAGSQQVSAVPAAGVAESLKSSMQVSGKSDPARPLPLVPGPKQNLPVPTGEKKKQKSLRPNRLLRAAGQEPGVALLPPARPTQTDPPAGVLPEESETPALAGPIRVRVVLGSRSVARMQEVAGISTPVAPAETKKGKREKSRVRLGLHNPEQSLPEDLQLATNQKNRPAAGLSTRIKL